MSGTFELLPAVDVAGRRAVQVVDGTDDDPLTVARRWVEQGATWVHLVDLDRAYRRGADLPFLADLVARLEVPVQLSGGLDSPAAVAEALGSGARRINLAATALRDLTWVAELVGEHGDRIAVGVDVAGDRVVARGSGEEIGPLDVVLDDLAEALAGTTPGAFVVADASRDGRLAGADRDLFATAAARLPGPVVASGGVAGLDDLLVLRDAGVSGAVLGAALHSGRFTLPDALEALR
ncbi:bifunctional 1-(5-phosphoribosyl)-5-((5-phosphoribosylamino) methylidenea mino)imidazole-4-carboxamide isomerase/phosphoribosylanthranilate isomerase PriA [Ornithinimicrobium humiphilum]|uniref:1-(5-phosphoribosyl)-5-[(5-phosphoribosylamino)methylideneamino] imidazole-4-carboxamide isomerase n=1 Tax=Ornithinimicrobium humiphilum TaxID=125288 RepID=A0A543KPR4_9MICO|nr:HisA/HisF-related TIM barrel protein [Ornithinimicrobium humiphilum]TQM97073.1 1-(5-phosphoribosyl)-5-[(5-phosphoribosylamino)methylideneamino] imidazole-4-carboxamide isomerase [Ornithinimicrobium humiphilum]